MMEVKVIKDKIKCIHCGSEIVLECTDTCMTKCSCGKVSTNNGVIIEGTQGIDWVDISPQLLNE